MSTAAPMQHQHSHDGDSSRSARIPRTRRSMPLLQHLSPCACRQFPCNALAIGILADHGCIFEIELLLFLGFFIASSCLVSGIFVGERHHQETTAAMPCCCVSFSCCMSLMFKISFSVRSKFESQNQLFSVFLESHSATSLFSMRFNHKYCQVHS